MKKLTTILLLFTLFSCGDDTVTISKSEYNQLKGIKQKTKRILTFPEGSNANYNYEWKIIKASDGHDYLEKGWLLENNSITKNVCEFDCSNGLGGIYSTDKKIILTTDQDLIADGIQAIDDTFLEWFCKNPSCEFIEVGTYAKKIRAEFDANGYREMDVFGKDYRITIPQEEPKQETLEEIETIGDFIKKESKSGNESVGIVKGANWQAERMYSEEDLREAFRQGQDNMDYSEIYGWDSKLTEQEWFEQFKKK
jgi:hypothetical protein